MLKAVETGNVELGGAVDAEEQRARVAPQATATTQSDAGTEGSCPSNTNPHTSQIQLAGFPEYRASGGFDWLEWIAVLNWQRLEKFQEVFAILTKCKAECQANGWDETWVELPGSAERVRISRIGVNRGGERGQHFEFKLCYRGMWLGLAKRERGSGKLPNLYVCQKGRECLLLGALEGFRLVREFVGSIGATFRYCAVSRVDFCLDVTELDVAELQLLVEHRQFVTRAKTMTPYRELIGDVCSGFAVGQAPQRLVVYDKVLQQADSYDDLYFQALVDRRWGGQRPIRAARIEFQVRCEKLVKYGIQSPEDLFRLSGSLLSMLTTDWFRITSEPVDRNNNHQGRANSLPLWESISAAFITLFGSPSGPLIPIARSKISAEKLVRQARGCLSSALLQMGMPLARYDQFVYEGAMLLNNLIDPKEKGKKFVDDYARRGKEHLS